MKTKEEISTYLEKYGFTIWSHNPEWTSLDFVTEDAIHIAVIPSTEDFQFFYVTKYFFGLTSNKCGSLFKEDHFKRILDQFFVVVKKCQELE